MAERAWNFYKGWTPYDARSKEIELFQVLVREAANEDLLRLYTAQLEALIDAQTFEMRARLDAEL